MLEEKLYESGSFHILNESLVLATGSTNGLIKSKNYIRCKRIHELLSLTFKILHFQSYLAKIANSEDVLDIRYNFIRIKYYQEKPRQ